MLKSTMLALCLAGLFTLVIAQDNPYCYTTYEDPCYGAPSDTKEDDFIIPGLPERSRKKRGATAVKNFLWPEGKVYYSISDLYTESQKYSILAGLHHIENRTCIRFEQKTDNTDNYMNIFPGIGCCSYIGYVGCGEQGVSLASGCLDSGTIVHEVLHALGFYHEHSRPDRDQYVKIIKNNIREGYEVNFGQETTQSIDSLGVDYDYNSVMHYCENSFSKSTNKKTLVPLDPNAVVCGVCELSPLDALQINLLYGCDASNPPPLSIVLPPKVDVSRPSLVKPFSCGDVFDDATKGSFSSPGYDNSNYPHNTKCGWLFRAKEGFLLQVVVTISVEFKPDCNKDYIQGKYGFSGNSLSNKYCGEKILTFSQLTEFALSMITDESNAPSSRTYKGISGTFSSTDINECSKDVCSHGCTNTDGSYYCSCPAGMYLSECNNKCLDINECLQDQHECDLTVSKCKNNYGSYTCECFQGYKLEDDTKTCTKNTSTASCSEDNGGCDQICTGSGDELSCSCNSGYTLQIDGKTCIDVNECAVDKGGCSHYCQNTKGSYTCDCLTGYELTENLHTCEDIDECKLLTGEENCDDVCYNTPGSFFCFCSLKRGFSYGPDSKFDSCHDIDECSSQNGGCEHNCHNTLGSYECSCQDGFTIMQDKRQCQDADECQTGNGGCEHVCTNTVGSYYCSCSNGYQLSVTNKKLCEDIDECASGVHRCSHTCINTDGSYMCSCPPDYVLDNNTMQCIAPKVPLKLCGADFTNESGIIIFNNDQAYSDCVWTIKLNDQSKRIIYSLQIDEMSKSDCSRCSVKIFNGGTVNSTIIDQYCQSTSKMISSAINEVTVFHQPGNGCENSSFVLTYSSTDSKKASLQCTNVLIPFPDTTYLISTPNFPFPQFSITGCDLYIFAVVSGVKIKFTLEYIDEVKDCSSDDKLGLKVYNQISAIDVNLQAHVCNPASVTTPFYSSTGRARINFFNTNPSRGYFGKVELVQ